MSTKKRGAAETAKAPGPWPRRLLALGLVAVACGAFVLYARERIASPDIKFLAPEHGARWIRQRRAFNISGWGPTQEIVFFRKRVVVPAGTSSAVVTVRALRTCMVFWDKERVFGPVKPEEWKEPHSITLAHLTPGEHTFEIFVENSYGPAAALVYCDALDLKSGPGWDQNVLGEQWQPAQLADDVAPPPLARRVGSPLDALAHSFWWLGPLFLAILGMLMATTRQAGERVLPNWWTASRCRFVVLAAWLVLAANNFLKLPPEMGYDLPAHVDYIRFIAERGELPDAHDGLQMFQAPLFYAVAAGVYRVLTLFLAGSTALLWLRWLSLLCGAAQVEICFRAGRLVFPGREDLQSLCVLLGGLLPMNVYMSQTLGNEPLCGVLSALVLLWGWQALRGADINEYAAHPPRRPWGLGLVFGLDLLTKMSALLLAPVVAGVLFVVQSPRSKVQGPENTARRLSLSDFGPWTLDFGPRLLACFAWCFGTAVAVSGWYYVRNWLRFGKFLVGGWDPVRGLPWWQDPGYRTPWQMVSFGHSLFQPIHAGFYSMADGFFTSLWLDGNLSGLNDWETRPPWNMTLLLAAPWPALILSAAIVAGLMRAVGSRDAALRHSLQLAGVSLLLYLAAFVLLWLEVPAFSQAKASYTLGLTPAYTVLCVAGLDLLPTSRPLRSAVAAFAVCWSVLVYGAYFVV